MTTRVFITGIGVISPLGLNASSTWEALKSGCSGVDLIQSFDTTNFETRIAAEVKGFDPVAHLGPKEARRTDRFAQFAVAACKEAMAQAQLDVSKVDRYRVAVLVGSGIGGLLTISQQHANLLEKGPNRVSPFLIPMMLGDMASAQISMLSGALGPNFCAVSSCSSGADAIGNALKLIRAGEADIVLAGGSEAPICPIAVAGFGAMKALSRRNDDPQKASRPFDATRDGFVMGEGSAILVLESHESVIRRGIQPLAELAGYGSTSDAFHVTEPAPEGESAAKAVKRTLKNAGLEPADIDYINAHGTSTPLNDKLETKALKLALGEIAYKIPVSSTKSMTGHLLGAGGAVEAAMCVLALREGVVPPTINHENPDPECDLDIVPNAARKKDLQAVLSTSFGFGGHNSVLAFTRANGA
ncbi:MAG: beta-ketoacyl-ACP synthase II [SAR202 cluster bacterium]|nr:beta-ketoacyl-ACP synthase II [SAR202 cluster bacterium]